jgi:hypothetical protein
MLIKFICSEGDMSSTDFVQATIDLVYEEYSHKYIKRFMGQIAFSNGSVLIAFLEQNAGKLFEIDFYNNDVKLDTLNNGELINIHRDVINDYCRIEFRKKEV